MGYGRWKMEDGRWTVGDGRWDEGAGSRAEGGGERDEIGSKIATARRKIDGQYGLDAGGDPEAPHSRTAL